MSEQQWRLVPVDITPEKTPEMFNAALKWGTKKSEWQELLAAAPQLPALGGEPEVLGWRVESHNGTCLTNYVQRPDWAYRENPKVYSIIELVDRAQVARLQAIAVQAEQDFKDVVGTIELRDIEIARLQAEVERLTARNAELVKAGKNLLRVLGMANSGSSAYNKAVMEFDAALAEGKEHE